MRSRGLLIGSVASLTLLGLVHQASAQRPGEASWPQNFVAQEKEPASFGFLVTRPGPIRVSVDAPALLLVTLAGPIPQPLERAQAGHIEILYEATPADVQRGSWWLVRIAPPAGQGLATGSLSILHPPVDPRAAAAALEQTHQQILARRSTRASDLAKLQASLEAQHDAARAQFVAAQKAKSEEILRSMQASAAVQARAIAPQAMVS